MLCHNSFRDCLTHMIVLRFRHLAHSRSIRHLGNWFAADISLQAGKPFDCACGPAYLYWPGLWARIRTISRNSGGTPAFIEAGLSALPTSNQKKIKIEYIRTMR